MTRSIIALAGVAASAGVVSAQGVAVSATGADNYVTQSISVVAPLYDGAAMLNTWSGGDMFGITDRVSAAGTLNGAPFAIMDDSNGTFTGDNQGIIDATDFGRFFGVVDTWNTANGNNGGTAVWTFNGGTNLAVSIDFAAMGDFENSNDSHLFEYSYDGLNFFPLFTSNVDEAGNMAYTMAGGGVFALDDPMTINGTYLDNNFQTIGAAATGSGATFTLLYKGQGDGGTEAFAFRNVYVTPTPGAVTLFGLAGLAGIRRRRA